MKSSICRLRAPLHFTLPLVSVLSLAALVGGCESSSDDDDDSGSEANVLLTDANNYESVSVLTIPKVQVQPGDIEICWDEVTLDIQCHDTDPAADIQAVSLLRFDGLTETDIEGLFGSAELSIEDVDAFFHYLPEGGTTCTDLSTMDRFGPLINVGEDFVENEDFTYVILASHSTVPGVGTRSMTFVEPTSAASATSVQMPIGCSADAQILDFDATISSAEVVSIPAAGPWVVDWRGVDHDSQGNSIDYDAIDSLAVGFYEGMTVGDIEEQVMDIELIATRLWDMPLDDQTSADLADATARDGGAKFDGFETDNEGVWLFALLCSGCQNPAPVVLSVLEPTGS